MNLQISLTEHIVKTDIITLRGRVDAFSVPTLRETQERLLEAGGKFFIVDLREVAFLDSAGMAALVSLLKRARQAGGNVTLVTPLESEAQRILMLTRFDQVFRMVSSVNDVLK